MVGKGVHGDRKSQDMTCHEENQKEHLADKQQFPAEWTHKHFAGIGHARDVRISPFKLPDHVACIRCYET